MARVLKLNRVAAGEYTAGAYTIRKALQRGGWIVHPTAERSGCILHADTLDDACSRLLERLQPGRTQGGA